MVPATPIVLSIKHRGTWTEHGIHVVTKGGTNRGIDKTWHAILVDRKRRPLLGGELSFVRLDPDEIEGIVRFTADQLELATAVELRPPR